MELTRDLLETVRTIADAWSPGVIMLKPFNGDLVMIAVTRVDMYTPSNNIHHSTIIGKDITLIVQQKLSITDPRGSSPVITYIDNIKKEETWEVPHTETYYWLKVNNVI